MHLEGVLAVLPILRRMAVLAGGPELAAMNIGVAIGTGGANMGETQIFMTSLAISAEVRADHGKAGFLMLESDRLFDDVPGGGVMAVETFPSELAVRIFRRLARRRLRNPDNRGRG